MFILAFMHVTDEDKPLPFILFTDPFTQFYSSPIFYNTETQIKGYESEDVFPLWLQDFINYFEELT